MTAALTRDQIFAADDLKREEVPVPEWDGVVWVRMLTGKERDKLESFWLERRDSKMFTDARAQLVALTACDENGQRLFSEDDVATLGGKSALPLQRVYDIAMRMNGFKKSDIEDLAGNSEGAPRGASTSA